jgi:hypothetical protein
LIGTPFVILALKWIFSLAINKAGRRVLRFNRPVYVVAGCLPLLLGLFCYAWAAGLMDNPAPFEWRTRARMHWVERNLNYGLSRTNQHNQPNSIQPGVYDLFSFLATSPGIGNDFTNEPSMTVDAWGRPMKIEVEALTNGWHFVSISAGKDAHFGTKDDIRVSNIFTRPFP